MKIKSFIFTILMMGIVLIVYLNIDSISKTIKSFLVSDNYVSVLDSNSYKRTYSYTRFYNSTEFSPINYYDIENVYYNILNNGHDDYTFYCDKEYSNCLNDIKEIALNDNLLSKINNYVHPFNSFNNIDTVISKDGKVRVKVTHKYDEEKIEVINNKVNQIISSLGLDNLSVKEKIGKVHDYIINNTVYDNEQISGTSEFDSTSAYGVLIEGAGVCSGYSDAMAIFLDRFDVPNLKISSENHIWNLVYLDGKWLHLDLTWDDTENTLYSDNYFLITKEKLFDLDNKEHMFDTSFYLEAN